MLTLHVEHPRPPIYGYPFDARKAPAIVPVSVTISSTSSVRIGAIRAAWQVTQQHPIAGQSILECWTWGEITALDTFLTEAQNHDIEIKPGKDHRTQVTLYLPYNLPPSILSHFERISHTLYVSVFPPSPAYRATSRSEPPTDPPKRGRLGSFIGKHKEEKPAEKKKASGDPLGEAFGPSLAKYQSEVRYVTPLHERGVSPLFDVTKIAPALGLGIVRGTAVSNVMTLGSGLIVCLRVDGIDPTATIHTGQIRLQQQSSSLDGSETHFDEFIIYKWFEPPDEEGNPRALWPNFDPIPPRSPAFPPRTTPDSLHLTALPRFPSPACGGRVTTGPGTRLSSMRHTLILELEFQPGDSSTRRKMQLKFDISLGDCTMAYDSVQTPRYTRSDSRPLVDLKACMDPYPKGTEPPGCLLSRTSWIVRDGKSLEPVRTLYHPARTRSHQQQTSSICMCFFEDTTGVVPPGASWSDHAEPLTSPHDMDAIEAYKLERDAAYVAGSERKSIPGFIHAYLDECICQHSSATGRVGPKAGLTAQPAH